MGITATRNSHQKLSQKRLPRCHPNKCTSWWSKWNSALRITRTKRDKCCCSIHNSPMHCFNQWLWCESSIHKRLWYVHWCQFLYRWIYQLIFVVAHFQTMLYKANQMPPVLTNSTPMIGQPMPQASANSGMNPMMTGMSNHFPSANQDVDLRSVVDPRLSRSMDMDMRSMPSNPVQNPGMMDPAFMRQGEFRLDFTVLRNSSTGGILKIVQSGQ